MRGKRCVELTYKLLFRITPACAGKTRDSDNQQNRAEDHPRVCGENSSLSKMALLQVGSPPRVRGKLANNVTSELSVRITPACAGKTLKSIKKFQNNKDHPRVCGENPQVYCREPAPVGSPPRVRGKRNFFNLLRI